MRPMARTRSHLTIFRPSCSYRWNVQPLPGSWNSRIRWTICKNFIASSWMKRICCCRISNPSWSACCCCGPRDASSSRWRPPCPLLKRRTSRSWCLWDLPSSGCPRCAPWSSMSSMKWLMWTRKLFNNSLNGIATFLPRRIGPWCIVGCGSRSSKWRPWPTMWHAWGPLIFMPISMRTLRRCNYSRGSRAKRVSWWPPGSSAVGTTIVR